MCKNVKSLSAGIPDSLVWSYNVVPENCYHADIGYYHTFGLELTGPDFSTTIHDVSVYMEIAAGMAEMFNKCQLEPDHFLDAVIDLISVAY